jgi:hypothetical protein
MWQRIQSVFLGITILSLLISLFFPVIGVEEGTVYRLYPIYLMIKTPGASGTVTASLYFPFCAASILIVAALLMAVQEIRRYDNRMLQVRLGTLNSLFLAGIMVCDVVFSNRVMKEYPGPWKYDYSLYLTFVAVLFNWLAIRFIRKDEKMVRDSDRIR